MKKHERDTPEPRNFGGILYDGVEVAACTRDRFGTVERCDSPKELAWRRVAFYTVALHLPRGGVDTAADCPSKGAALALGRMLARRTEYGLQDFTGGMPEVGA